MKKLVLCAVVILFAGCKKVDKLSVKEMRGDLAILWSAIKELHPGYGIYTPADSLEKSYNAVYASLDEPLTESEFIPRIYPFLCALGCGHTQIEHSKNYQPPASAHLPFEVLVHQHRAWVTTSRTGRLATGDEVISINGEPVSAIIEHGKALYCGDGYVESFKELFLSEYDGFEDACNKYYHWKAPYRVTISTNKGGLKEVVLDSADRQPVVGYQDKYASWLKVDSGEDCRLYFSKTGETGLFEINGLAYTDTISYQQCFDKVARQGIKNLILDMRHNGGGDLRIAIKLLSYLTDSSFGIVKDIKSRIPNPAKNPFSVYFDSTRTESFNGSCLPGRQEGAWYHMDINPEFARIYAPLAMAGAGRFRGRLFVLIDGATFSSAALFTSALKAQRKDVVFIGRETAGAEEGCNGFAMQKLTLPNTGISVVFPWLRVVSMAKSPVFGRGLMPDYPVAYTAEDVVRGRDLDLEKVVGVIDLEAGLNVE